MLEILRQGLATEFPNPKRIGCPGNVLLKGMAQGRMSPLKQSLGLNTSAHAVRAFKNSRSFVGKWRSNADGCLFG